MSHLSNHQGWVAGVLSKSSTTKTRDTQIPTVTRRDTTAPRVTVRGPDGSAGCTKNSNGLQDPGLFAPHSESGIRAPPHFLCVALDIRHSPVRAERARAHGFSGSIMLVLFSFCLALAFWLWLFHRHDDEIGRASHRMSYHCSRARASTERQHREGSSSSTGGSSSRKKTHTASASRRTGSSYD